MRHLYLLEHQHHSGGRQFWQRSGCRLSFVLEVLVTAVSCRLFGPIWTSASSGIEKAICDTATKGLDPARALEPFVLTHTMVDEIHKHGGTLLGTSRGPVNIDAAVENLIFRKVDMLFCIGGDVTQRGACALYEACEKRGHALSVVGIPKTIDNDVRYVSRTFGLPHRN